ncbi:MAG: 16S rRNA (adenine(1518)-N(6)/adenine(1519)-N(6))-dimethyltransferase RsmA [Anaerolineae bacterium]|jgi:16S rRNA (adenine1518-N6/adenine1519-N6)-dimethyltransferase|nr:16S rRNA (adenine(1518)-N(6)/adenine(1519)-N(6))-dimethyltransferase RsmA [Anaerolineae bacterium]
MNPKALLDKYGIQPKKSLGQNFLHDPNVLEKIVNSADLLRDDTVLEIGPGTGALTQKLAEAAHQVYTIELDQRMRPLLEAQLALYPRVTLVFEDVLAVDHLSLVGPGEFVVVANVPYYITSAILRQLLEAPRRPRRIVLTVQLEVAERVSAKPGEMSLLAVSVQFYGKPQVIGKLNPAVFWPRPEVESAILKIDTYDRPIVDVPSEAAFFRVVRAGFSQKRKQLKNALSGGLQLNGADTETLLHTAGIDPKRRAETLTLAEWAAITRVFHTEKQQFG